MKQRKHQSQQRRAQRSGDGQNFQPPKEELYVNYNSTAQHLNELFDTDYNCRFNKRARNCYCCGAFFHYTTEVGFSLKPRLT